MVIQDPYIKEICQIEAATIIKNIGEPVITQTPDGIITSWNVAAELQYGYLANEAINQSILLIIPNDKHAEMKKLLKKVYLGEFVQQYETVRINKLGS